MPAALRRNYYSDHSARAILATKHKISQLMHHHGISLAELSRRTGIPDRTLKRWLDDTDSTHPQLPGLFMIADHLGVSIRDLLPDDRIRFVDDDRYQAIVPFYSLPIEHVRWLYDHYRRAKSLLSHSD